MNFFNMVKFQLKLLLKTPAIFTSYFIYPPLLTLIIGYLAKNNFGGGFSSYEFYSLSMMLFMYLGAGLAAVYNFMDKPIKDGGLRTIYIPVKTSSIYLSQVVSGTIFCSLGLIFNIVIFKLLFNIDYNGSIGIVIISFITLAFMSNALGVFVCTVNENVLAVNMIFNLIQCVLGVLGGAFFSLEALGKIPAMLSKFSPVKWIMDGLLNSIYDSNNSILIIVILINILLAIIFILACKKTFKTEKYIG